MPTSMGLRAKLAAPCDWLCIESAQSGAESGADNRTEEKATSTESRENGDMLVGAEPCGTARESLLAPRGSELSPLTTPKTPISPKRGTESGTLAARNAAQTDPDLALIVAHWFDLPDKVKAQIVKAVEPYSRPRDPVARRQAVQQALRKAHDDQDPCQGPDVGEIGQQWASGATDGP